MSTAPAVFRFYSQVQGIRTSRWQRFLSGLRVFFLTLLFGWPALLVVLSIFAQHALTPEARGMVAALAALAMAVFFGWRHLRGHIHTVEFSEGSVELISGRKRIVLDAGSVQGLIGAGGMQLVLGEMVVWMRTLIVAEDRAYPLLLKKEDNPPTYELLREVCVHAWGVPFGGRLETPVAGPELSAEEYLAALVNVRKHYFRLTRRALFVGLVTAFGALGVFVALLLKLGAGGQHVRRLFWLGLISLVGFVTIYRAVRQIGVYWKIKQVERRLQEAL
jgi:hypothetical protein